MNPEPTVRAIFVRHPVTRQDVNATPWALRDARPTAVLVADKMSMIAQAKICAMRAFLVFGR